MNKYSEPLFQKSNFSPPGMITFSNIFITPPKTFQCVLRSRGERNTDFVRFVLILPIFATKRPDYSNLHPRASLNMLIANARKAVRQKDAPQCYKSDLKCTELCQCDSCENLYVADELTEIEAQFLEYEFEEGDDVDDDDIDF